MKSYTFIHFSKNVNSDIENLINKFKVENSIPEYIYHKNEYCIKFYSEFAAKFIREYIDNFIKFPDYLLVVDIKPIEADPIEYDQDFEAQIVVDTLLVDTFGIDSVLINNRNQTFIALTTIQQLDMLELSILNKCKTLGPESLTNQEHIFIQNRLK